LISIVGSSSARLMTNAGSPRASPSLTWVSKGSVASLLVVLSNLLRSAEKLTQFFSTSPWPQPNMALIFPIRRTCHWVATCASETTISFATRSISRSVSNDGRHNASCRCGRRNTSS
jgi:hypothetical protein